MRLFHPLRAILLAACVMLGAPACRTMQSDPSDTAEAPDNATLRVTNDNFSDVDVYIVRSGMPQRIGRVSAGHTQQFPLRPTVLGTGDVTFVASTVDGRGAASSGSLIVTGGRTVDFRVAAVLSQSVATVH